MLLELAWHSLRARRGSVLLTLLSLSLGVVLVLAVEQIGRELRNGFTRSVSGVDLVVGARTSPLHLLLFSIFRSGSASRDLAWASYEVLAADPRVAWSVPLALGDSHRGFRVVGTTPEYFAQFRYGERQALQLAVGAGLDAPQAAVLGADVARVLGYGPGSAIVLAHGLVDTAFSRHDTQPFIVSGVLAATGTPVDQAIHVRLEDLDAMHGIAHGADNAAAGAAGHDHDHERDDAHEEHQHDDEHAHEHDGDITTAQASAKAAAASGLQGAARTLAGTRQVSAVLLGLKSRSDVFVLQRDIEAYDGEALTAVLPGVALAELWRGLRIGEQVLAGISATVLLAALLGLATMLLVSMQQRQRELALYRSLGARRHFIILLVETEALLLTSGGLLAGFALACGLQWLLAPLLQQRYGLVLAGLPFSPQVAAFAAAALLLTAVLALIPAAAAYRQSPVTALRASA